MQPEQRSRTGKAPDLRLPPDAAALPAVGATTGDGGGYDAGYRAGFAARVAVERRRQQVRWLFGSWFVYWLSLLAASLQPLAAALWAREVTRTSAAQGPIQVTITLDTALPALLWIAIGPLVLTLLWLLLVRRRRPPHRAASTAHGQVGAGDVL